MEEKSGDSHPSVPLWLDCDPGHDDAFAILLAAQHPQLHLLGISTTHGNAPLEATTQNALSILEAVGRTDVPVHPGAAKPFCRNAHHAPNIHGESGLDGTELLPTPTVQAIYKPNAVLAMRHALLDQPEGEAWVVATGTLTNVALLFAIFPELVSHTKGLSIMGGAIGGNFTNAVLGTVEGEGERFGNITPWAEFNIWCDPEAAHSIFSNAKLASKTVLIPLDLTHKVLATPLIQHKILTPSHSSFTQSPAPIRQLFYDLLTFYAKTYEGVFGISEGPPLHDPIAVAVLLDGIASPASEPGLMRPFDDNGGERWKIDVVTDRILDTSDSGLKSPKTGQTGRTVSTPSSDGIGVRIPRDVDKEWFWDLIFRCLARAEEAAPPTLNATHALPP